MKDPISKFRFDEDSDNGRTKRQHLHSNSKKSPSSGTNPYYSSNLDFKEHNLTPKTPQPREHRHFRFSNSVDSFTEQPHFDSGGGGGYTEQPHCRSSGDGGFIEHIPDYTDPGMDYPQATHDLSPPRRGGDYSLVSPPKVPAPHSRTPSYQTREPHVSPHYKQEDYDSGYPVTYGFSDSQDHNSNNLLATSPHKNLPDKNVHSSSSQDYNGVEGNNQSYPSRENTLDLSKSASSADSRGDFNSGSGSSGKVYHHNAHFPQSGHAQSLKYARERNLREARENLRYRSSSLGENGSTRNLSDAKDITKGRTPSAPGDLSHHRGNHSGASIYYGDRDRNVEYARGLHTAAVRSMGSVVMGDRTTRSGHSIKSGDFRDTRVSRRDTADAGDFSSRGIMSGEYRVQENHNRSIISAASSNVRMEDSLKRSNTSPHSRDSSTVVNNTNYSLTSLTRDHLTQRRLPSSQPNGAATLLHDKPTTPDLPSTPPGGGKCGVLNSSKDSSLISQSGGQRTHLYGNDYGVINSLVSLAFMSLLSLVIGFIALQLLFRLNSRTVDGGRPNAATDSVLTTNASYGNVLDVTIALATFVVMLDLCCLLVCSMQCFFAAKLVKCPRGDERCFKYLKECAGTRFIAVTGFFLSIPALLLALLLYMLLEFSATPAIVATVILTVGLTFTTITLVHSVYFWRVEKTKAELNIPPYGSRRHADTVGGKGGPARGGGGVLSQSELSTLV